MPSSIGRFKWLSGGTPLEYSGDTALNVAGDTISFAAGHLQPQFWPIALGAFALWGAGVYGKLRN